MLHLLGFSTIDLFLARKDLKSQALSTIVFLKQVVSQERVEGGGLKIVLSVQRR